LWLLVEDIFGDVNCAGLIWFRIGDGSRFGTGGGIEADMYSKIDGCYETEFTEESSLDSSYTRVYVQEERVCGVDLLRNGRGTWEVGLLWLFGTSIRYF
jgi:hypothetical protein